MKFEEGKSYRVKNKALLNNKIYRCKKSMDGVLRLYWEHKGSTYSLVVSPGWKSGMNREDFEEVSE